LALLQKSLLDPIELLTETPNNLDLVAAEDTDGIAIGDAVSQRLERSAQILS
jgi:adenine/guanine phosphoribosyltransferase-like PRPP-binding protein